MLLLSQKNAAEYKTLLLFFNDFLSYVFQIACVAENFAEIKLSVRDQKNFSRM